jgi:hypothetical protein
LAVGLLLLAALVWLVELLLLQPQVHVLAVESELLAAQSLIQLCHREISRKTEFFTA